MLTCYLIGHGPLVECLRSFVEQHPFAQLVGHQRFPDSFLNKIFAIRPQILLVDFSDRQMIMKSFGRIAEFCTIVYFSGDQKGAFTAFEDGAIDYLVAPIIFARFETCLSKIARLIFHRTGERHNISRSGLDSFFITTDVKGKTERMINSSEILMIEATENHVLLTMVDERRHICFNTMKEMEKSLPGYFMRVHKSFIINYRKVSAVKGTTVILEGNSLYTVPIGVTFRKSFVNRKNEMTIGRLDRQGPTVPAVWAEDLSIN